MLETIVEVIESILSFLLMPILLPITLLYTWIIRPFLENVSQHGLIAALLIFIGCAVPVVLFVRWRVRLHQRKRYWRKRVYQDEQLSPNETEQMRIETRDGLADFITGLYFWLY